MSIEHAPLSVQFVCAGAFQALTMLRLAGPVAAIPATRANAVTPTEIAPIIEKAICQVSDGMVCFTMPWVA